jgi:hypothetical protein
MRNKYDVVFKKNGNINKEIIEARNCSSAVEKIKDKHNTTHILRVNKHDPLNDLYQIFGIRR